MARASSPDRIIPHPGLSAAVEGGMSRDAAARRFGVSIASAVRWMDAYLPQRPDRGEAARRRPALGSDRALADLLSRRHRADAGQHPAELRERLIKERGERFRDQHDPRLLSAPRAADATQTAHASEQEREDVKACREAWFDLQPELDPEKLVFLDETGRRPRWPACADAAPRRASAAGPPSPMALKTTTARRGAAPRRASAAPWSSTGR